MPSWRKNWFRCSLKESTFGKHEQGRNESALDVAFNL